MDRQQTIKITGSKLLLQMIDMACLIFEFCDSATLFTLSMTCTKIRTHLTSENL